MTIIIACSIAFFSTVAFVTLWFCIVKKDLKTKQNIIESAKSQLAASRTQRLRARNAQEIEKAQEILDRSLDIYNQSMELYNETLQKPWNTVPAFFLRFNSVVEGEKK